MTTFILFVALAALGAPITQVTEARSAPRRSAPASRCPFWRCSTIPACSTKRKSTKCHGKRDRRIHRSLAMGSKSSSSVHTGAPCSAAHAATSRSPTPKRRPLATPTRTQRSTSAQVSVEGVSGLSAPSVRDNKDTDWGPAHERSSTRTGIGSRTASPSSSRSSTGRTADFGSRRKATQTDVSTTITSAAAANASARRSTRPARPVP